MELDKRIMPGKRPLSCFDTEQAMQFIGKQCYFSDDARDFMNLDKADGDTLFYVAELQNIWTAEEYCFADNSNDWRFILPLEWVREEKSEPEPKYRVLTLNEFLERFKIGDAIYIRFKKDGAERVVIFSGYNIPPHKDEGNNTESVCLNGIEHHLKSIVCLGMREYNLTTLFDCYEYFDGKEWQPFGVKEIPEV